MIRFGAGHVVKAAIPPASCLWCDEGFDEAGGVLLNDGQCPFHTDCLQRMVVGGVNHQRRTCTCCGGQRAFGPAQPVQARGCPGRRHALSACTAPRKRPMVRHEPPGAPGLVQGTRPANTSPRTTSARRSSSMISDLTKHKGHRALRGHARQGGPDLRHARRPRAGRAVDRGVQLMAGNNGGRHRLPADLAAKHRPRTAPTTRKPGAFRTAVDDRHLRSSKPVTMVDARDRLADELDQLRAAYVVLSTNVELRLDGKPRAGASEPADPRCRPLLPAQGQADRPGLRPVTHRSRRTWAAIAAHLDATRTIERHGVGTLEQMFAGFLALPPPGRSSCGRSSASGPTRPSPAR